jgi:hypothetical protein
MRLVLSGISARLDALQVCVPDTLVEAVHAVVCQAGHEYQLHSEQKKRQLPQQQTSDSLDSTVEQRSSGPAASHTWRMRSSTYSNQLC